MRFIHLSDIRIGNSTESGTGWAESRRKELEGGILRAMQEAEAFGARLVLISGGLFSHVPTTGELDRVSRVFASFPDIRVVIIAGQNDIVKRSSPVRSFVWPENVFFAAGGRVERIVLRDIDTEIFAASVTDTENAGPEDFAAAAGEKHEDSCTVRLALLRCNDDEAAAEAFAGTDLSYAAVGSDISGYRSISAKVYCPGFFEPEKMGDSGSHGLIRGIISDRTGMPESIEFVPMASVSYVPLLIRINVKTTAEELKMLIEREIGRRGSSNIYRLKLTGNRNPEEDFDLDRLTSVYRISEIIDETEPEYDYRRLFAEHPQDMIGFYISRIVSDSNEMSRVEKRAMYYGLDALLKTEE